MKKVIEFITDMGDGGAETLVKDYALLLDHTKFDTVILTRYPIKNSANMKFLIANNIRIISINSSDSSFAKLWNKLTFRIRMPFIMKKIILSERPDVIHVHLAQLGYLRTVAEYLKGISLFYTCHNVVSHYFGDNCNKERKAAEYLIKNNNLRLIALHDDMKIELNELFNVNNSIVIHNGIDFQRFLNVKVTKEQKRRELNIPENAFVLGHIGRFAKQKNHPFLIEIFKNVIKKNPNAYLLMIGAGDSSYVIQKMKEYKLEKNYQILSNRDDIPELLKAMDVFVFPSQFEGLGIVLIEAQIANLPCVVSDVIPTEAIKKNNIKVCSLKNSPMEWSNVILNELSVEENNDSLKEYDMNHEIKRLEMLYLNKL